MLEILGVPPVLSRRTGRRAMLQAGGAGLLGLSLPGVMTAEEAGAAASRYAVRHRPLRLL